MSKPASEPNLLICEQTEGIVRLILNRPDKRNALSLDLLRAIQRELTRLETDSTARVIVLSGNGPAFCAGHDLGEMSQRPETDYHTLFSTCSDVMMHLRRMPQPVIARIQGIATAAGCQLAAACDLAIASDQAKFATPGVKIGLFCTTPMVPLVRAIPEKSAMEMLLTGLPITAQRAYELGLVNRVTTADELDRVIQEYCDLLVGSSPLTLQIGKQAFYRQRKMSEKEAYNDAIMVMTDNAQRNDAQEGIAAFLEKRAPLWSGS